MNKDTMDDDLDKDFEGLDLFEPSMRFSKNVVEQVKLETKLIKPERGPIYWLPRIFAGSALTVFMLVVGLLVFNQTDFSEVTINPQMGQAVMAIFGTVVGITFLLGIDRIFKKLMLD